MCQAAKAIGNTELENKFAGGESLKSKFNIGLIFMLSLLYTGIVKIKRDIVFAASLYL